jgi:hypothetical protein
VLTEILVVLTFNIDKDVWVIGVAQRRPEENTSVGSRHGVLSATGLGKIASSVDKKSGTHLKVG